MKFFIATSMKALPIFLQKYVSGAEYEFVYVLCVSAGKPVSAIEWDVVDSPTKASYTIPPITCPVIPYNPPRAIVVPHQGEPRLVSCLCTLVAGVNDA